MKVILTNSTYNAIMNLLNFSLDLSRGQTQRTLILRDGVAEAWIKKRRILFYVRQKSQVAYH